MRLVLLILTTWITPVALADWSGDSTLGTSVSVAIRPNGVFVMGRPGFINPAFADYFRAALASIRSDERISIDIDYCFKIPVAFCTSPQSGPTPTEREVETFGELQYMTVGYAGAYRHPEGWARKCDQDWCPTSQPNLFDTSLGALLFEVDYWLKTWVIGKDPISGAPIRGC